MILEPAGGYASLFLDICIKNILGIDFLHVKDDLKGLLKSRSWKNKEKYMHVFYKLLGLSECQTELSNFGMLPSRKMKISVGYFTHLLTSIIS